MMELYTLCMGHMMIGFVGYGVFEAIFNYRNRTRHAN